MAVLYCLLAALYAAGLAALVSTLNILNWNPDLT
jgi:hypothetical protein